MTFHFSNSFVVVDDDYITARSTATGFPKIGVMDFWNWKRRFRANDLTTNDYLLKFRMVPTTALVGIFLNDVNFDTIRVEAHGTDSWTDPDFSTGDLTVSPNKITDTYGIYIPMTGYASSKEWIRLFIPSGTFAVGSYTTKWEICTVCFLYSSIQLAHGIALDYVQEPYHFYKDCINERIKTGEIIRWQAQMPFGNRDIASPEDWYNVGKMDMSEPFIFYDDRESTADAHLCVRDDSLKFTEFDLNAMHGNSVAVREVYKIGAEK